MKCYILLFGLVMLVLYACSKPVEPLADFAQRISTADRLVVTNRCFAYGSTITGAEVSNLVNAVKSAKKKTWGKAWGKDLDRQPRIWGVEFYEGTNYLAVAPMGYGLFQIEGIEYIDGTGTVEAFWKKLEEVTAKIPLPN